MKKLWKINTINKVLSLHARLSRIDANKKPLSAAQDFKRIVIFSTTALGDLLFNTPAIRAIRNRYPAAKIMLVSSYKNRDLVQGSTWFDEVVIWDNKVKNIFSVIKAMRKFKAEITFILHSRIGYDILCSRLGGSRYIVRDNFSSDTTIFNRWIDLYSKEKNLHIIQRKLNLIAQLGCDITNISMQFPNDYNTPISSNNNATIAFQLGASEKLRCWPVEHYSNLAQTIISRHPSTHIVLTGAEQDLKLASAFYAALPEQYHPNVVSYIGKTRLPELIKLIYSVDALVTGDTGPLHIAITARTRTVSLYVSANPAHTGPYQDPQLHRTIRIEPEKNDDPIYPLRKIGVAKVYEALASILE
ncbi:glycosyltransferase family 9 protein [Pantoea dispersa]|uniref:glycosyltransferase family 9 protein n=1 Tax=Pantoea dispersa TaxID=59814 RepID=UPI00123BC295|nr:glycosyltransferase family 9 protein [Pantoea dispersa]KAA8670561.1 glycosyltransferase family 9 protein [Pantoea dispersa]